MAASSTKKKVRRTVTDGIAHIHASFNNTIVMITEEHAVCGSGCRGARWRSSERIRLEEH